jgi:hypothetical protein
MRCDKHTDLEKSTTKQVRTSKRQKRPPNNQEKLFFIGEDKCATGSKELLIYHQNICGLKKKTDELINCPVAILTYFLRPWIVLSSHSIKLI